MALPGIVAALAFLGVAGLVLGLYWAFEGGRQVRERLASAGPGGLGLDADILRKVERSGAGKSLHANLTTLIEQSGYQRSTNDVVLVIGACALLGGALGWVRTGGLIGGILTAALVGSVPVFFLMYKRQKRLQLFEQQFPDALDAMARSIRAGNALAGAIQLVGEEMPPPVGQEFRRVEEEVRLGLDPSEALTKLTVRAPTEDVGFFSAAIRIQRASGGNLAELLDRLSEVIRERYKILSHARVLSAQHRWTAIFVGLSPVLFAAILQLMQPGYFAPLLKSALGPMLIGAGLALEVIGFVVIYRIAKIKV
jgi:tight adherence protein B